MHAKEAGAVAVIVWDTRPEDGLLYAGVIGVAIPVGVVTFGDGALLQRQLRATGALLVRLVSLFARAAASP